MPPIRVPKLIQLEPVECLPQIHRLRVEAPGAGSVLQVPVVDGWIQLNLVFKDLGKWRAQASFARELQKTLLVLKRGHQIDRAYAIHKSPGLRLRFRLSEKALIQGKVSGAFLGTLTRFLDRIVQRGWVASIGFDSFLEQHHLLSQFQHRDAETVLDLCFQEALKSQVSRRKCSEVEWAEFLVGFLNFFYEDPWWVWEALNRHSTLRTVYYVTSEIPSLPLFDPRGILPALRRSRLTLQREGEFKGSTSLLMVLSYVMNMWGVDPGTEQEILERAIKMVRPSIVSSP